MENHFAQCDLPRDWSEWAEGWEFGDDNPALTTFGILSPPLEFYKTCAMCAAERRALLYSATRILGEWSIRTFSLKCESKAPTHLFQTRFLNTDKEISCCCLAPWVPNGTGRSRCQIRRLEPRMAAYLPDGRFADSTMPGFRGGIFRADSAAFGDVIMGKWYIIRYGGLTSANFGLPPIF